ncbi:MAG: hypothetical protein HY390_05530 [Deltaproteobacteria bacterium]|nr:hypothetical protein [Deltaproteobacteria bacterium]
MDWDISTQRVRNLGSRSARFGSADRAEHEPTEAMRIIEYFFSTPLGAILKLK